MKSFILSLTAVLFISCNVFAQFPLNIGIGGGTSHSVYSTNVDTITQQGRVGWNGGVFARLKLKKWYVGVDAMLVSKPGKFSSSSGQTNGEIDVIGLDVPVMAGYKLIKSKVFSLRLHAGASMQYAFFDKVKSSFNGSSLETDTDWQFKGGAQWAGLGGVGVDIAMITLDARYLYSFTNSSNIANIELNNQQIQFIIGWKFL